MTTLILILLVAGLAGLALGLEVIRRRDRDHASTLLSIATDGLVTNPAYSVASFRSAMAHYLAGVTARARNQLRREPAFTYALDHLEAAVLMQMNSLDDEKVVPTFKQIAKRIGGGTRLVDEAIVRTVVHYLKHRGLVKLVALHSGQGQAAGRGYVLTPAGEVAKALFVEHGKRQLKANAVAG